MKPLPLFALSPLLSPADYWRLMERFRPVAGWVPR